MKNLILSYWPSKVKSRFEEVNTCIKQNLTSEYFSNIIFFVHTEHNNILQEFLKNIEYKKNKPSIEVHVSNDDPSYQLFFDTINQKYQNLDYINILSNSDILFDDTIKLIDNIKNSEFYCLTRYENDKLHADACLKWSDPKEGIIPYSDSQDVWIWRGENKIKNATEVFIGRPGCDNKIALKAFINNYVVSNPCLDVKTYHIHKTNIRDGTSQDISKRVKKPYLYIKPTNIQEQNRKYIFDDDNKLFPLMYTEDEQRNNTVLNNIKIMFKEKL